MHKLVNQCILLEYIVFYTSICKTLIYRLYLLCHSPFPTYNFLSFPQVEIHSLISIFNKP